MLFNQIDWIGFISWFVFIFWQLDNGGSRRGRKWYEESKNKIKGAPPGWLFGIAWPILYALIFTSTFIYWQQFNTDSHYFITLLLIFINIVLNKLWSLFFFNLSQRLISVIIIFILDGLNIAILILLGFSKAWVSFSLFIPYVLWVLYATYLNIAWYRLKLPTRTTYKKRKNKININNNILI